MIIHFTTLKICSQPIENRQIICYNINTYLFGGAVVKTVLKAITIFICVIVLIPVLFYATISIVNNCIANNIEQQLIALELPENTELSDSISIAAKIFGNGNGMQYFGAILVTSDLSEDELKEYYAQFDEKYFIEKKEDNFVINEQYDYVFTNFDNESQSNYMIWCIKYNSEKLAETGNFLYEVLDLDIRGK